MTSPRGASCEHIDRVLVALSRESVTVDLGSGAQVADGDDCSNLVLLSCPVCRVTLESSDWDTGRCP